MPRRSSSSMYFCPARRCSFQRFDVVVCTYEGGYVAKWICASRYERCCVTSDEDGPCSFGVVHCDWSIPGWRCGDIASLTLLPRCPRVISVILLHCPPLLGPRRWHSRITQIVLMVGVSHRVFPPFLASSVITRSMANCRLLDDKTVGLNRVRVYSRNSRKGEVT